MPKAALITGGAKRIGQSITRKLHAQGFDVALHYRNSTQEAHSLAAELNGLRKDSVFCLQADLNKQEDVHRLAAQALDCWQGIDVLINNASSFYPTTIGSVTDSQWHDLMASNLKAPFFLSQDLRDSLNQRHGCIINIIDIHADRPLHGYPVYSIAKAGLAMLTKTLAKELGPEIRVNGISPGAILWPESAGGDKSNAGFEESEKSAIAQIPLQRLGDTNDIANTVLFLINQAPYINGQIIAVDGGRSLQI